MIAQHWSCLTLPLDATLTPSQKSLLLTNLVLSRLLQSRYITSMYFIFTTLTSVGFGNVAPNSSLEKLTSIMVMLLGCKSLLLSTHLSLRYPCRYLGSLGTQCGTPGILSALLVPSSWWYCTMWHDVARHHALSRASYAKLLFALFEPKSGSSFPSPENGGRGLKCYLLSQGKPCTFLLLLIWRKPLFLGSCYFCFVLLLINVKYFGGDTQKILSLLNLFKCKFQTLKTITIKKYKVAIMKITPLLIDDPHKLANY